MTQPPSNQPPGGFGAPDPNVPPVPPMPPQAPPVPPQAPAPQTPPPGPYGYPQQAPQAPQTPPPGQPGPYGYPQQPGPYAQQPGPYGQQPGPYGQQPNPYGGYPTAPMQQAPPPGGGKNPFKGKPGVIVAAAAAALLVIGGVSWFALSGDDEKEPIAQPTNSATTTPKPTDSVDEGDGSGDGENGDESLNAGRKDGEAKINWLLKNNVDLPRNGADVYGPWIVGDTVVKAMYKGIDGYSLSDGSAKWHLDVPFELCAAPPEPSADGVMVFAYNDSAGDRAKCTQMQQVDLKTGKAGWKKAVPKATGLFAFSDNTLTISGNTVTAAGSSSAYGFSLADGRQLFSSPTSGCKPFAYAGGSKLIAASKCPSGDVNKQSQAVSEVDPNTGKPKWTFKLEVDWEVDRVYSVDPLVISATQREQKKWAIFSLKANGTERSQIQGGKDKFAPRCGGSFVVFGKNLQGCTGVAADANTFYMSTETAYGTPNEVIAFDLNTGKPKWRSKAPGEQQMKPLRMEGSDVLLYIEPRYDAGGAVATVAPTGGAPKVLLQHQAAVSTVESSFYSAGYAYGNGTFVIAAGRVSASNDKEEKETKTMMAYGK
ncbi:MULTISPECIES: PQQ-binding-like beta-propeller repeat protein [unclassified Streptomyces]|uniref:outer membrane protein assembly factor BamB family protein n=1 Tax=unclassified Streptomyces TaxID=2593676 RepID=UPI002E2EF93C|nr:PQQ-binding-like beta-propeller repeat protein [Streptomyces sp. NBC_01268]